MRGRAAAPGSNPLMPQMLALALIEGLHAVLAHGQRWAHAQGLHGLHGWVPLLASPHQTADLSLPRPPQLSRALALSVGHRAAVLRRMQPRRCCVRQRQHPLRWAWRYPTERPSCLLEPALMVVLMVPRMRVLQLGAWLATTVLGHLLGALLQGSPQGCRLMVQLAAWVLVMLQLLEQQQHRCLRTTAIPAGHHLAQHLHWDVAAAERAALLAKAAAARLDGAAGAAAGCGCSIGDRLMHLLELLAADVR